MERFLDYTSQTWDNGLRRLCNKYDLDTGGTPDGGRYFSGYIDCAEISEFLVREREDSEKRIKTLLAICDAAFERIGNLESQIATLAPLKEELDKMREEIESIQISSDFR